MFKVKHLRQLRISFSSWNENSSTSCRAEEVAQRLRALVAFLGDLVQFPSSTHMTTLQSQGIQHTYGVQTHV